MMADALQPDAEMLAAFVHDRLDPETESAVRQWLYTGATEAELSLYQALVEERAANERALAFWATRPLRAKLFRLIEQMRGPLNEETIETVRRPLAMGPLSKTQADELVFEVEVGTLVDLRLRLGAPANYAVFLLQEDGTVNVLGHGMASNADAVDLRGMELEPGDGELQLYAILDPSEPISPPPANADEAWLVAMLSTRTQERRILHRSLRAIREPAARGD